MHPIQALAALHDLGLSVQPISGGRLYVVPRERITPDVRHLIVAHRDALVDLVRRRQADIDPVDLIVTYEERLAICSEAGDVSEIKARLSTPQMNAASLAQNSSTWPRTLRRHNETHCKKG